VGLSSQDGAVITVRGPRDAAGLGLVHAHEHLVAHPPASVVARDPDHALDDPAPVLEDLRAFRDAGGGAIVEMTTVDYGRDVPALLALAERSGVAIVAATGFNKDVLCAPFCAGRDPDELARTQIAEVVDGVDGSGIRCGVVKLATSLDAITPAETVALRAAAATHRATGVPILTHTEAGTFAIRQLELLGAEGVDPGAVTLGHMDRNPDLGLHRELARTGAFLSYDHVPKLRYATADDAVGLIVELARDGLHGQIVVGGDFARRSMFRGWGGGPGLTWIATVFAQRVRDAARAAGLDGDEVVDAILRRNPARALRLREI
jgi:predicted metal-dependent phosphotriesterase family hydrolase